MTAPNDRPTPPRGSAWELRRKMADELVVCRAERDKWREIAGNNADERDSLRAANQVLAEQVRTLREPCQCVEETIFDAYNHKFDAEHVNRVCALLSPGRAALSAADSKETEANK